MFGVSYNQALTPRLSVGGDGNFNAAQEAAQLQFGFKYNTPGYAHDISEGIGHGGRVEKRDGGIALICVVGERFLGRGGGRGLRTNNGHAAVGGKSDEVSADFERKWGKQAA